LVLSDFEKPNIEIQSPLELTCNRPFIDIFTLNNSPQHPVTYQWSTQNGNISSPTTNLETITIDQAGSYTLIVQSTRNGCMDTLSQTVIEDKELPIADAGADINLHCGNINLVLDGRNSSGRGPLEYNWTTTNGTFTTPTNQSTVGINSPGNYTLVVLQAENGCTDTATVNVVQLSDGKVDITIQSPTCTGGVGNISVIPTITFQAP